MNIDSILISEFASTDPLGRLTVVNSYNRLNAPVVPLGVETMCLSLVVHGSLQEAGSEHEGEIRLINGRRESVTQDPLKFKFAFPDADNVDEGMPVRWIGTIRIMRLVLSEFGPYAFEVYIDGTYHASASLFVRRHGG